MVQEASRKNGAKEIEKKARTDRTAALEVARQLVVSDTPAPVRKRYLINDTTVEKLGEILNQNPQGVTVFRDELIGFLKALDKDGQEGARAFYLEAWNGTDRKTFDRIGRGTLDIESTTVSIIGGIQPGPLGDYLREAQRGGKGDDGLIQRFQLAVWPTASKDWKNVDRWPDTQAKRIAHEVFRRLDQMTAADCGAVSDPHDADGIPCLQFADDAQHAFDAWRVVLESRLRSDEEHPAMESHLAKYRSLVPSLALLIHLADEGTGPVKHASLQRALRWVEYLESHARRIYSAAVKPAISAARALAKKLMAREVADGFAIRDVYRKGWALLASKEEAAAAVDVLIDLDWLRSDERLTDTKPALVHFINPRIYECAPVRTDKTDKSPSPASTPSESVSFVSDPPGTNENICDENASDENEVCEWSA
jgi:putative DNA primase/helicase